LLLLRGLEDLEGAHESLVDAHHGAGVVELTAVVGGREKGDQLPLGEELVAVLNDLVGSADEVHVVLLEELADDVWAEGERDTAVVLTPAGDVFVWVRPEEVAEETSVGHVGGPHDPPDLLHGLQVGGKAAVHAEDLLIDDGSNGEAVEAVREGLPELDVVPPLA